MDGQIRCSSTNWIRSQRIVRKRKFCGIIKYYSHRLEKERKKAAVEWDKKEQQLIEDFYKQKFIEEGKWKETGLTNETFSPEGWKPIAGKRRGRKFDQDDDI